MSYTAGNSSIGENGSITGGAAGDQKQSTVPDYNGEVKFRSFPYSDSRGFYVLRPKNATHAYNMAVCMIKACNNPNIGYNQNSRDGIVKYGVETTTKCNSDCSSTIRACVKEGTGKDPGDFNTTSEPSVLAATGLFEDKFTYSNQKLYNGDVIVTRSKGHTLMIVNGSPREGTQDTNLSLTAGGLKSLDGITVDSSSSSGAGAGGGDLYDTITTRADSIIREVGYWSNNKLTTSSSKIKCSVINYTTALGAFFKGAIGSGDSSGYASGSANTSVSVSGATSTNMRAVLQELLNQGYSRAMAAGIGGNIQQESNYDPAAYARSTNTEAYGLCQWTNNYKRGYDTGTRMLQWVGSDWKTNITKQIQYLDYTLQTGYGSLRSDMMACANTYNGALQVMELFLRRYEQPGNYSTEISRRTPYTQTAWNAMVDIL